AAFQKAWLLDEISGDGLEKLAEAHLALGEDSGAIRAWEARIERDGADGQFFSALAAAYRRQGDMAGAAAAVQAWQEQYPGDAHAAYALGIHLVLVSPQDAEQMLKLASELAPAYTVKCDGLVEGVQTALTFDDDAYRLLLFGRALGKAGEWELAEIAFREVTELAPDYAEGWGMLGEARQQVGKDGLSALEQAQTLGPDAVLVRSLWALYWRRQGEPQVALPIYKRLAAEEPEQAAWQAEIGYSLTEMGDILSALPYYQQAASLAGDNVLYWQVLARFSIENGIEAREVGLPAARMALLLRPDDPATLDLMGWTMIYFHDWASAERFLQQAIQKDAAYGSAYLHLGQVYVHTGQHALAKRHLLQAVSLDETGFNGAIAQRLLDGLP
ncbi:MAG: tetratricopeptide repeat protein, partial [Anaerolineaceae bacterium]|nr:tetratricopeptide repeat protein [Anaerolineaceae bacterium]